MTTLADFVAEDSPLMVEARRRRISKPFLAYILATAWHENAHSLTPAVENLAYSAKRLRQVWPARFDKSQAEAAASAGPETIANKVYADRMGNGNEASGDGWRYRGRGYVQITGRENYRRMGERLGIPLEASPELALKPDVAAKIIFEGMMDGLFTGRSLRSYIKNGTVRDYVGARKVVNPDRNGVVIADVADQFLTMLADVDLLKDSRIINAAESQKRWAWFGKVLSAITLIGSGLASGAADPALVALREYFPWIGGVVGAVMLLSFIIVTLRANQTEDAREDDHEKKGV